MHISNNFPVMPLLLVQGHTIAVSINYPLAVGILSTSKVNTEMGNLSVYPGLRTGCQLACNVRLDNEKKGRPLSCS